MILIFINCARNRFCDDKQSISLHLDGKSCCIISLESATNPDGEPIENLSKRDKADPKTKSTEAAKAGDEVQPNHLVGYLEL